MDVRKTFSIVVVCYNAGDRLCQTVDSILGQSYPDYEILVEDGMSTDGSVETLPRDERIRLFRERDEGIYDAMNRAVRRAEGSYVYFLNCGDLFYDREVLYQTARTIRERRDTVPAVCYGNIYERKTGQIVYSNPVIDAFACYRNVPCHQACFYDRRLFAEREFEPRYRVRADYEHFLWCFFCRKAAMHYFPVVIASYEGGGFSETGENRKLSEREHREIVRRYLTAGQALRYRLVLLLTLAPLRTRLAENKITAGIYHSLKRAFYRLRKR